MIYFDVTKSAKARHASGLMRVNRRLRDELGEAVQPVVWGKDRPDFRPDDWYFTTETFDVAQRPGFAEFLDRPPCRLAALFPDAIPLHLPQVTWPHSVARHPGYMTALAKFDHVFAISAAVQRDLTGFWQWQGRQTTTAVSVLPLGADFDGSARHPRRDVVPPPVLLCVGIVEPRKNQGFLIDVAQALKARGQDFELHVVGRVNPHFGGAIAERIRGAVTTKLGVQFHEAASDEVLAELLGRTRAVVFPTIAEGCGLPVIESLWRGLPCVCTDLPVLRELTDEGGCLVLPKNDAAAWGEGLARVLSDDAYWRALADRAAERRLPTWADSAVEIRRVLG
ncbi:glycosyltransferase [Actomonas aquatica]|uniref:Glycosyltransferase n=1 Tax=Actomonas aquatica TaxID=2866162 RepID=A0ABZ1CAA5_9BACT|nr:glycosyltransferase [Opitutus sp. WL0086]WRQ88534.1 glycosyltransferase [Opitutus sp. WL0086]